MQLPRRFEWLTGIVVAGLFVAVAQGCAGGVRFQGVVGEVAPGEASGVSGSAIASEVK